MIVPGTKSTMADLRWLRERGIDRAVAALRTRERALLVGICGGLQMLGRTIDDPLGVEGGGRCEGLGVFAAASTFAAEKRTVPVAGESTAFGTPVAFTGYEIHAGVTWFGTDAPFAQLRAPHGAPQRDGAIAWDGRALGTYVHGLFAGDAARHAFLRWARMRCGRSSPMPLIAVEARRDERLDALADIVEASLDLRGLVPAGALFA